MVCSRRFNAVRSPSSASSPYLSQLQHGAVWTSPFQSDIGGGIRGPVVLESAGLWRRNAASCRPLHPQELHPSAVLEWAGGTCQFGYVGRYPLRFTTEPGGQR